MAIPPSDVLTQAARGQIRPIHSIVVGERHRKDMGDIAGLALDIPPSLRRAAP
jgi:hypothetical protein